MQGVLLRTVRNARSEDCLLRSGKLSQRAAPWDSQPKLIQGGSLRYPDPSKPSAQGSPLTGTICSDKPNGKPQLNCNQ